jgi:hypothetical protein
MLPPAASDSDEPLAVRRYERPDRGKDGRFQAQGGPDEDETGTRGAEGVPLYLLLHYYDPFLI